MPALVTIDVNRKLVITVCSDTVTDEEFIQARKQVLADPTFEPSFDRLWDFSAVTGEQISNETIAHLVQTSPFSGDILRAVVVSMSAKALKRVMEFVSLSRGFNQRIAAFPTREAAWQWLESERRERVHLTEGNSESVREPAEQTERLDLCDSVVSVISCKIRRTRRRSRRQARRGSYSLH